LQVSRRVTPGADKPYDVPRVRDFNVTPPITQNTTNRCSQDPPLSEKRKLTEELFGRGKTIGTLFGTNFSLLVGPAELEIVSRAAEIYGIISAN
jgi:hypothetical protein